MHAEHRGFFLLHATPPTWVKPASAAAWVRSVPTPRDLAGPRAPATAASVAAWGRESPAGGRARPTCEEADGQRARERESESE